MSIEDSIEKLPDEVYELILAYGCECHAVGSNTYEPIAEEQRKKRDKLLEELLIVLTSYIRE